jgi:zinc/manganese transport system substrate-binding protein
MARTRRSFVARKALDYDDDESLLLCYNVTCEVTCPASVCKIEDMPHLGSRKGQRKQMRKCALISVIGLLALMAMWRPVSAEGKIKVVAAENFYGDVAQQIGGDRIEVTSILSNPDQDPHLFETSPGVVRRIAAAQFVIYNGADYDPWMERLLRVTARSNRIVIVVADLMHKKAGDNPHLWYDPQTMPVVARSLASAFAKEDPVHKDDYAAHLKTFITFLEPLNRKIAEIRNKFAGATITATEPVFGYMAASLRLRMIDQHFQLAIMNDIEPSPGDLAELQDELRRHKVRVLVYNKQASNQITQRLVSLARASSIPVVGVTETCPPGLSYQNWILGELNDTEKALAQSMPQAPCTPCTPSN